VRTTRRSTKFAALAVGLSLIAAACGDDDDTADTPVTTAAGTTATTTAGTTADTTADTTEDTTADTTEDTTDDTTDDTTADTTDDTTGDTTEDTAGEEPAGDAAMRLTIELNPEAVWNDGTPITVADFECTWNAVLNTPGSLTTVGYDKITSVAAGESEQQVVVEFSEVYAPYKTLFGGLIKADSVDDCNDISQDFGQMIEWSGREYQLESWSPEGSTFVPNENYWGDEPQNFEQVTMVPLADSDTEIAAIRAGEVDFIYPQFFTGIEEALADPNIEVSIGFGGDFEALYFQQEEGPFADPVFREAFSKSIDRNAVFEQIYVPIVEGAEMLNCGPIVPGPYCPNNDVFGETYDPEGAATLLEGEGWTKNADGKWQSPDGEVPQVRWIINTGNTRRESTQAFLIPILQEAGFDVIADNCDAACYFQQRLPSLDYDLAMYISTVAPDPAYLTSSFHCDQVPSEANNNAGQNSSGWCNEEASDLLDQADKEVDPDARAELIQQFLEFTEQDSVLLPLFQFPKSAAWRTDKVGGNVEGDLLNYMAFNNWGEWEDVDGDGTLVIGAEQWPECLNPLTECANSSWYQWTAGFVLLPGVWDTTNEFTFEPTALVTEEPTVEIL
jgi:peptide/nickel transport system substrate-binding protein